MRLLIILSLMISNSVCLADEKPTRFSLWKGQAPNGDGTFEDGEAWLTLHRPETPSGPAIIICPGGGYGGLVTGAEGHEIAKWLNRHSITGLVLEYRLPKGRPFVPLLDAQHAIRTARANAIDWKIDSDKLGIIGFSAGGHLASTAATHFDKGDKNSEEPIKRQSSRPDFAILVYPVITMAPTTHGGSRRRLLGEKPLTELIELFSNEKQVTAQSSPTFLTHALDDKVVVPANSRAFHDALKKHNVPTEYLELPSGGHGLNRYQGPMWEAWQKRSLEWLNNLHKEQTTKP
jgi:acetyl esterase/lipase